MNTQSPTKPLPPGVQSQNTSQPNTESTTNKAFFDDDESGSRFELVTPNESHQKDLSLPPSVGKFFLVRTPPGDIPKVNAYALHGKLLAHYKEENDTKPDYVLDLLHSRLKPLKPGEDGPDYGFSVMKNGSNFEFFSSDKTIIDQWLEALKKVCVLTTFHDDYKAIKMIGRGSFAKVYLVESKTTGKSFAVKAFTKETMAVSNKANAKPSMLNEIEIMRAVDHENIIKLYEVYETEKSIYLVLELIQGKSLYEFLKKANFREEVSSTKIINMVRSLLDALAYLASKGIMHRDLKPDNILLDKGEKVKIVDFGLATFIDVPNYIFKKCGTPGYIAPEVFKFDDKIPETAYNDRCDVFSVGCLLYYMLFNTPLFEGNTAADILKLNRKYTADFPVLNNIRLELKDSSSKISKDGINLLIDLVEFDTRKRISANEALSHPYFVPVPTGMQKIVGTNEFVVDALSKYSQAEIYSPCSPLKFNSIPQEPVYSPNTPHTPLTPLTPLRVDSYEIASPLLPKKGDRFVREDSLYLDVGRPEINGRLDTITNASMNNSLLLNARADSTNNLGSACLPSSFAKKDTSNRSSSKSTFKAHGSGAGNKSFLKAAIFRNMQKNNSEGYRDEETFKSKFEEATSATRQEKTKDEDGESGSIPSIGVSPSKNFGSSPSKDPYNIKEKENEAEGNDEVSNEQSDTQLNVERINFYTHGKHTAKAANPKMRRFQPFAPGNLIIPKNDAFNNQ